MPAQVVVVLQNASVAKELSDAIQANGHTVQPFTDPLQALDALERAEKIELLITCIQFPANKPNGRSLALMAKMKRPGIKVIFISRPGEEQHVSDLGSCLPPPIDVLQVSTLAEKLLAEII